MFIGEEQPRILLVEDGEVVAELIRRTLADVGEVTVVGTAEDALERLLDGEWNLLMADVELPGINGLELLVRAKERYPQLMAIVVSAKEDFDYAVKAIRAGAVDYISKPFDPEEFRMKVRKAISTDRFNRTLRRPQETVLAIGAHPDDVEIGCAGVLLRHAGVGHDVHLLTLTTGEAGGHPAVRVAESERAAEAMSAELHMLDLDDTAIAETAQTVRAISEVVERVGPTTIYTHSSRDVHQDHRAAHNATLVAARRVPRIYAYQTPSTTVEFRPSRFISIDDVLDRKLEAIAAFESQTAIRAYLAPDLLNATARYWGRFATSLYAEPLEVIREGDIVPAGGGVQDDGAAERGGATSLHASW
jgi:LmbE family N-acetylglucosaminyl deacetylase/ActR/RegA family two-component response regulator